MEYYRSMSSIILSSRAAVPEDFPHQEEAGQEGQAEQTHSTMDSFQDRQQDQVRSITIIAAALSACLHLFSELLAADAKPAASLFHVYSATCRQSILLQLAAAITDCMGTCLPEGENVFCRYNAKRRHWRRTKLGF